MPPQRGVGTPAALRNESERESLLRVATAASGASDLSDVLELAADEARRAIAAASLSISRLDEGGTVLKTLINVGELGRGEERFPEDETYPTADYPLIERMVETGQPYFNALDDPGCDPQARRILGWLNKGSELGVAIRVEGQVWGEIWAAKAIGDPPFSSDNVAFLEAIAGQFAIAIGRAELFSAVSRLAYEDTLTGLPNRRALEERLDRAIARALAEEAPLSLLLCDLDGLKQINDVRGHHSGDRALRGVAEALVASAAFQPGAFAARLAGDEFCMLLEGIDLDAAVATGSALIASLSEVDGAQLSLSCGAGTLDATVRTRGELLRAADTALYVAKRRGGGRVCSVAETSGEAPPSRERRRRDLANPGRARIAEAAGELTELLDGRLAKAPVLDRLEAVAVALTEAGDFPSWAISFAPRGTGTIHDVSLGDNRDRAYSNVRIATAMDGFPLDEYPATAAVVERGSGCFKVERSDPAGDPAERSLLEAMGYDSVIGASAAADDGVHLIELYGDERTCRLDDVETALRLATRAAIPPPGHGHPGSPEARTPSRAAALSLVLARRLASIENAELAAQATAEEVQAAYGCRIVHIVRASGSELELWAESGPAATEPGWRQSAEAGLIGRCLRESEPVLVTDVRREPQFRSNSATADILSELAVPVRLGGGTWGVINLEDSRVGAFDADDLRLLEAIAAQLAGALRGIELYERLDRAYFDTAEALAAALEAKDSYTAEHSRSIAERAIAVGERLGMSGDELRFLRYGAAFHDIGKLAIPRTILNKPEALSAEERTVIEQHTLIGERILSSIEFLRPVLPLVRSAHERWDGSGYPDGLAGEEIPFGARIIFACDAYDAMTTDRSYRRAMGDESARDELRRGAGSQFDPTVVEALLAVLEAERHDGGRAAEITASAAPRLEVPGERPASRAEHKASAAGSPVAG